MHDALGVLVLLERGFRINSGFMMNCEICSIFSGVSSIHGSHLESLVNSNAFGRLNP